jgi:enoyl-CoA hydratase
MNDLYRSGERTGKMGMKHLIFEISDHGIGTVRINRPEARNALSRETVDELDRLARMIHDQKPIRVLIIGSSGHFAAGADIKNMAEFGVEEARAFSFSETFNRIANLEIPTIAAIEGFALGGGLELALACDLRIASKTAKLGFPEIKLGIMPGAGGTVRAPRLIGAAFAKELIFLGETIDADRAERMGLVNKVVEPEELTRSAMEWAEKLCAKSPVALKAAKTTIQVCLEETLLCRAIAAEGNNWAELFGTEDQKEGMRAFIEKRAPVYRGR